MGRVLAVGLDAVDEVDLEQRIGRGELPNLAALRERGTWCSLVVDSPCRSEHPWVAFATGRDPQRSRWWTFVGFDPTTYTCPTRGVPDVEPFWTVGDQATVVVFDVPTAVLARDLRGVQVLGWGIQDLRFPRSSRPPELLGEVEARFGASQAIPLQHSGTWNDAGWFDRYGPVLLDSISTRLHVIQSLLARTPDWSLGVVVFGEQHQLAHHAWHGVSPESVLTGVSTADVARRTLRDVYRALDEAIGRLGAALGPDDHLVVFSPKGSEPLCDLTSTVLVPELLHRLAFGEALLLQPSVERWRRRGYPAVVPPGGMSHLTYLGAGFGAHGMARRISRLRRSLWVGTTAAAYRVAPRTVDRLRARRRRPEPQPPIASDPDTLVPFQGGLDHDGWHVATWYRPWWPRMRAFVLPSFSDLHVRLNLAGRERDGTVAASDYAQACDEVEQTLRACRSARTGRPLFTDVMRPRAADPFEPDGIPADLVISWTEDTDAIEHPEAGVVGPYPAWRPAGHSNRAFALMAGGEIGAAHVTGHRLVDLPATLLDLAGVEPHTPIDGKPIPLAPRMHSRT